MSELEEITRVVELMRSRGIVRLKTAGYEIELDPFDPYPFSIEAVEAQQTAPAEKEKVNRDTGLTDAQEREAFGA